MSEVKLTVPAPKEVVDVLVALSGLADKIAAHEPGSQIAAEELEVILGLYPELKKLPADILQQSDEVADAAELFVRRMVYKLLGKPITPVVVS